MLKIQVLNDIMLSVGNTPKDLISSATPMWEPQTQKNMNVNQNPLLPPKSMVYERKIPSYIPCPVPGHIAEGPALNSDNVLCTVHIKAHCSSATLS